MIFLRKFWKSILWTIIMGVMLFLPGNEIPHTKLLNFPNSDKFVHFILFAVLQFLIFYESKISPIELKFRNCLLLIGIVIFYGSASELIQEFFIYERSGSIFDFLADLAGLSFAFLFYVFFKKFISQSSLQTF
jgi:VanZ family protein